MFSSPSISKFSFRIASRRQRLTVASTQSCRKKSFACSFTRREWIICRVNCTSSGRARALGIICLLPALLLRGLMPGLRSREATSLDRPRSSWGTVEGDSFRTPAIFFWFNERSSADFRGPSFAFFREGVEAGAAHISRAAPSNRHEKKAAAMKERCRKTFPRDGGAGGWDCKAS